MTMLLSPLSVRPVSGTRAVPLVVVSAFVLCLVAAMVPVLTVETPPLADYLNHLARMHAIMQVDHDPLLARFYRIDWMVLPNLAMDLVVPPLMHLVDVYTAGRITILATMVLLVTGPFAVQWAIHRRLDGFPFIGFLLLYSFALLQGLMNYLMGVGVAVWALAAWIALSDGPVWRRALVSSVFVLVLFLCHLSALGLYGLGVLCFEAWRLWRHRGQSWRRHLAELAAFGLPFLLPLPLMLASPTATLAGDTDTVFALEDKSEGFEWLWNAYYENGPDQIWALLAVALLVWALWRRGIAAHPAAKILMPTSAVVFLAMPLVLLGSWGADVRLPVGMGFLMAGFFRLKFAQVRQSHLFLAGVVILALARIGGVEAAWLEVDRDLHDFRASFAAITPGSRVLVAEADTPTGGFAYNRPLSHVACLAMIERSAFVSDAFTQPGKQVLAVRAPYLAMSNVEDDEEPSLAELVAAREAPDAAKGLYWAQWWRNYDYVYVLYTGTPARPQAVGLQPIYDGHRFELYRVTTIDVGSPSP